MCTSGPTLYMFYGRYPVSVSLHVLCLFSTCHTCMLSAECSRYAAHAAVDTYHPITAIDVLSDMPFKPS